VLRTIMLSVWAKRCDVVESSNPVTGDELVTETIITPIDATAIMTAAKTKKTTFRSERIDLV